MREFKPILGLDEYKQTRLLSIHVMVQDGKETSLTVSVAEQIKTIKEKVLGDAAAKDLPSYKVIHLPSRRIIEDQRSVEQEGIEDGDHFLICPKRRNISSPFRKSTFSSKGPDLNAIKQCTEFLGEEKGTSMAYSPIGPPGIFDFFSELKRILTSLTEVASLIQHVNSDDDESSGDASSTGSNDLGIKVDPLCIQKLTDMGFSEGRARKALIVNRMCPVQAMEWLLLHESDPDIDSPLTAEDLDSYIPQRKRQKKRVVNKKKEVAPPSRVVTRFREMGFSEKDVAEALRMTGNNEERALDWLLGDKTVHEASSEEGLDVSSPQYIAIMENPVVQLGLTNPRILHAFEDMLENPNSSGQYINDPEIGPVLLQISRIVQSFSR